MKNSIKILLVAILSIIGIALVWEFLYIKNISMKVVYIFPEGFKGVVIIVHNQNEGIDDTKEDGKVIYRIPSSGVLKIKRPLEGTISQSWYYFEDEQGKRTEFMYCFPSCDEMKLNPDKVYAFGLSKGGAEEGKYSIETISFLVGTSNDTDTLSKILEKYSPAEVIKNNRIMARTMAGGGPNK